MGGHYREEKNKDGVGSSYGRFSLLVAQHRWCPRAARSYRARGYDAIWRSTQTEPANKLGEWALHLRLSKRQQSGALQEHSRPPRHATLVVGNNWQVSRGAGYGGRWRFGHL